MLQKVLIANRGEIALRVARACRELGVKSVAVYSTADAESAVVRFADESVHIGPPASGRSYLHIPSIIGAAQKTGADAIHPGYGFLSEDPYFAEICANEGLTFIGPKPEVMEQVGDKATARDLMQKAGLPLLPGTVDPVATADDARSIAEEIGYPVIIKAVAGGGGRGMTVVWKPEELADAYRTTRSTAQVVFKDSAVYIERYLQAPRHTEIQIVCDEHGNGAYFGERDCSVQRRHQKLIEEAPSIHLTPEMRKDIGEKAVNGALSIGYTGAGTMEFLLDHDGNFAFMEMNARIQVEHPVSEMITIGRPDPGADPRRLRRAALRQAGRDRVPGPFDRVPDQRGGPGEELRPDRGPARDVRGPGRAVDARRLALLPGLDGEPVLRLADREADRLGARPRARDRPHAARARGVPDLGARREDHDPLPPGDPRRRPVPLRRRLHRLRRALHGRAGDRARRGGRLERREMATDDKDRQIAELTRRLDQEVGTLNRLIEITGLLNSTLNVDELLAMIMRSGADLLEAETSSLFLLDEERNELEIAVATGAPAEDVMRKRIPADTGIAGWVVENGEAAVVDDPANDPRFYGGIDEGSGFQTRNMRRRARCGRRRR